MKETKQIRAGEAPIRRVYEPVHAVEYAVITSRDDFSLVLIGQDTWIVTDLDISYGALLRLVMEGRPIPVERSSEVVRCVIPTPGLEKMLRKVFDDAEVVRSDGAV